MIEVGKKDYGSFVSQLSSYMPQVIFLAGEHDDAGNLVKDFPKYGLAMTQFIGGDGIDDEEFIKLGGKSSEGAVVISPAPIVDEDFILEYKNHFKKEPSGYAANSYDAANILINAIIKVKIKDSEKIAKEVSTTMSFHGVSGLISFNENGDLTSPGFVLSKVVNGKFMVIQNDKK
jgi:branched-chain amino acid transport system substrate-binding protein